jgi:formate dehydrogenase iron-sulfur subunit
MATEITPGNAYGFFTDTSVCIGCKACEVACKEWNQLPEKEDELGFLGQSLDNTGELNGTTWRHVQFIDNVPDETMTEGNGKAFLLMSDVCKHCQHASCLDVCPTGAIIRTEFDTVNIQEDVCNGCRNCIAACPYDVIEVNDEKNVAQKCTLCYDRLQGGMEPACAKACPTDSIQFGQLDDLRKRAKKREAQLHAQGLKEANLYGADDDVYGGLNAFFLLMDEPETYNLPNAESAVLPQRNNLGGYLGVFATAVLGLFGAVIARRERNRQRGEDAGAPEGGEHA